MSYRNERKQQINKAIGLRQKDIANLSKLKDKDGKPRSQRDVARIKRAIQVDIAYLQHEAAMLDEQPTGLSYTPCMVVAHTHDEVIVIRASSFSTVGKPLGRVCLLPYHDAVTLWQAGKSLFGG